MFQSCQGLISENSCRHPGSCKAAIRDLPTLERMKIPDRATRVWDDARLWNLSGPRAFLRTPPGKRRDGARGYAMRVISIRAFALDLVSGLAGDGALAQSERPWVDPPMRRPAEPAPSASQPPQATAPADAARPSPRLPARAPEPSPQRAGAPLVRGAGGGAGAFGSGARTTPPPNSRSPHGLAGGSARSAGRGAAERRGAGRPGRRGGRDRGRSPGRRLSRLPGPLRMP